MPQLVCKFMTNPKFIETAVAGFLFWWSGAIIGFHKLPGSYRTYLDQYYVISK